MKSNNLLEHGLCEEPEYQGCKIINFTSDKAKFTYKLDSPMNLDKKGIYNVAIEFLAIHNSKRKIVEDVNDTFRFSTDNVQNWMNYVIPQGTYSMRKLVDEINKWAIEKIENNKSWSFSLCGYYDNRV